MLMGEFLKRDEYSGSGSQKQVWLQDKDEDKDKEASFNVAYF